MNPEAVVVDLRTDGGILIVDDDDDVRGVMAEILSEQGFVIATAANGAEALDALRAGLRPSLILLDLMMPVMDGEAFCRVWHEDPSLSTIPVIIVSADSRAEQRSKACGATALLKKPVALGDMLGVVQRYAAPST